MGRLARTVERLADPRVQVAFNGLFTLLWFCMVPVTLVVAPLRQAIFYVALMSVWANFATHLGALISALVNVRAKGIESSVQLTHIEQMELRILNKLGANDNEAS